VFYEFDIFFHLSQGRRGISAEFGQFLFCCEALREERLFSFVKCTCIVPSGGAASSTGQASIYESLPESHETTANLSVEAREDEAREFMHIVRRIATLLLLEPRLDQNYIFTKAHF
jgi:hypothetical protein